VYPSQANFICFEVPDASKVYKQLEAKGILIRSFGNAPILGNCVRISVGSKEQNDILLKELAECLK
ncbi:MAG TPA: histidinol-phosphate transaminase, partial [Clostridium sp.]|nr:histidinol-phosphate transaminase [Clostridium sp.]